ncbi:PAS fold protein [Mariprofundus micogutta]|uniref:PAS fold protein n=1 Tax=Mariprofundus micogutta TaxID=1921010 RepID=A0A1L8CKE5_9PROT|nr:PAS domain S-box protein [Mariprofundus micogutta]GAV19387.1 PAS fold protein [Mariprofundus micogutta]
MRKVFTNWANLSSHAGAMLMAPAVLAIGVLAYSHFSWNKQMIEEAPLLDVVMEIKVELERTHMRLHEVERGMIILPAITEQKVLQEQHDHIIYNIDQTFESLANLDTYIAQLLTGTTIMGNVTLSHVEAKKSTDAELNEDLEKLKAAITTLKEYLTANLQGDAYQSFIYDSENDMMFDDAQEIAQSADDRVHEIIKEKLSLQRRVFLLFVIFFTLLSGYFVLKWKQLKDRHHNDLADLYLSVQAIDQSDEAIIIADRNGIIDLVNSRFCEVTGYESEDVIAQELSILDTGEHSIANDALPFVLEGMKWQLEVSCKGKNGGNYRSHTTIHPIRDRADNVAFCEIRQTIL